MLHTRSGYRSGSNHGFHDAIHRAIIYHSTLVTRHGHRAIRGVDIRGMLHSRGISAPLQYPQSGPKHRTARWVATCKRWKLSAGIVRGLYRPRKKCKLGGRRTKWNTKSSTTRPSPLVAILGARPRSRGGGLKVSGLAREGLRVFTRLRMHSLYIPSRGLI
jgi:hypothetical protein